MDTMDYENKKLVMSRIGMSIKKTNLLQQFLLIYMYDFVFSGYFKFNFETPNFHNLRETAITRKSIKITHLIINRPLYFRLNSRALQLSCHTLNLIRFPYSVLISSMPAADQM